MAGHGLDLVVRHERPMSPDDAAARGHVEHVALAQELLGALLADDGAAIDLRRNLEADPAREIGLDRAGDHIDARPLRRHDEMNASRARHLRKALHRIFDVLAGDHHEIGHFVDDDHDVGHRDRLERLFLLDRLVGVRIEAGLHHAPQLLPAKLRRGDLLRCSS